MVGRATGPAHGDCRRLDGGSSSSFAAAGQVLVDSISYSLAGAGLVLGTVVMNRGVMGGLAGLSLGLSLGPLVYAGAKAGKVIE